MTPRYLLDIRSTTAGSRFHALAGVFNDWTFRHIDALHLPPDAACWEIGAGGPTDDIRRQFVQLLAQRGVDRAFGRTLPDRLRCLGLVDVGADAYLTLAVPTTRTLDHANVAQLFAALVATGTPAADLEHHLRALRAGAVDIATPPLVSAWARAALNRNVGSRLVRPSRTRHHRCRRTPSA